MVRCYYLPLAIGRAKVPCLLGGGKYNFKFICLELFVDIFQHSTFIEFVGNQICKAVYMLVEVVFLVIKQLLVKVKVKISLFCYSPNAVLIVILALIGDPHAGVVLYKLGDLLHWSCGSTVWHMMVI